MWWTAVFEPVWTVSLLPSNATPWERVLDEVDGNLAARDPIGLIAASRVVAEVPEAWLPYLAEERSVDEFSSSWPVARRRAVTAASFDMHRVKGTRPVMERALAPLELQARVVEWFEVTPTRRPYTFRVSVVVGQTREWVAGARREVIRVANAAKNAHTLLEAVEVRRNVGPAMVYVGGYTIRKRTLRVGSIPALDTIRVPAFTYVGAAQIRRRTLRIGPR